MRSLFSARVSRVIRGTCGTEPTVHSQITQRSTGSALDLAVVAGKEVEDGVEGIPAHFTRLLLCDFCECERGRTLEVDIIREREGG